MSNAKRKNMSIKQLKGGISPGMVVSILNLAATLIKLLANIQSFSRTVAVGVENRAPGLKLIYNSSSCAHGRFQQAPDGIIPYDEAEAISGVNKDGSIATGVQGIVVYDCLDALTNEKKFSVVVAFDCPFVGSYKTAADIGNYGSFSNNDLSRMMDKLDESGGHKDYNGYRITWSSGAPKQIFSVMPV